MRLPQQAFWFTAKRSPDAARPYRVPGYPFTSDHFHSRGYGSGRQHHCHAAGSSRDWSWNRASLPVLPRMPSGAHREARIEDRPWP